MTDFWSQFEEVPENSSDFWAQFEEIPEQREQTQNLPFELTEEQKAKIKSNNEAYENKKWGRYAKFLDDFNTGFDEGVISGSERLVNGATFGFYDKLNPEAKQRADELQQRAESVGLGTANKIANAGTEITGALLNPLNKFLGTSSQVAKNASLATKAGNALKNTVIRAGEGAGLSALYGAGHSDDIVDYFANGDVKEDLKTGAIWSNIFPALGIVGKPILSGAGKILGWTTGTGEAIKDAAIAGTNKSKTFADNMRGRVSPADVAELAEKRIMDIRNANYKAYEKAMEETGKKEGVSLNEIFDTFKGIVKQTEKEKPYLLEKGEKKVIKEANKLLKDFEKDTAHRTVKDFDDLKQSIYKINTGDNDAAYKVKMSLYNGIKDSILKQAPEYAKIMKQTQEAIEQVQELKTALKLGNKKANPTQVLKKMQQAYRNNALSGYKNGERVLNSIDQGDREVIDALAGQAVNSLVPRGLAGGAATGFYAMLQGLLTPQGAVAAVSASPRAVGELAYYLGRMQPAAREISKLNPSSLQGMLEILEKYK